MLNVPDEISLPSNLNGVEKFFKADQVFIEVEFGVESYRLNDFVMFIDELDQKLYTIIEE